MPLRTFTDSAGVVWRVWATVPTNAAVLSRDYEQGWLTFESDGALKRLAPIPRDWAEFSHGRLELMCKAASDVPRRTALRMESANQRRIADRRESDAGA